MKAQHPPAAPPAPPPPPDGMPRPALGLREALAIILGIVIGAGIFRAPSMVASMSGSSAWMFSAWVLGGLISLVGALCYAELATTWPHAGGDYHFLQRAYGRGVSLLFAWARLSVITTGSIALLAFVFGDYMTAVLPLAVGSTELSSALYAALAVIGLTAVNLVGVRAGTRAQIWLTLTEVLGLLLIVGAALAAPGVAPPRESPPEAGPASPAAFGMAMVFVLLTYGGWNEAAYLSAELREPRRNMVRALVLSILLITLLYCVVNWAYWCGLGLEGMARSNAIAADLLKVAFGPIGEAGVSVLVALTALTSINATMIVGARTGYALGRDWPTLRVLGRWDRERGAPLTALRMQCLAALALVMIGAASGSGFRAMVEFTAPVFWLFFLLTGLSLFVLRRKEPHVARPFRVPLYPLLPLLFCAMCIYMLWSSLSYVSSQSWGPLNAAWISVAVLAAGLVLLVLLRPPPAAPSTSSPHPPHPPRGVGHDPH